MSDGVNGADRQDDPVELLVGEGKKYKTVQDLAKSRVEADQFIEQLKSENAALREAVKTKTTTSRMEDFDTFIAELKGQPPKDKASDGGDNQTPKPLTLEDVEQALERREKQRRVDASFAAVKDELRKVYGDQTDAVLAKAMQDHQLSEDIVKSLAFRSTASAIGALGLNTPAQAPQGIKPSVESGAFFGSKAGDRNWSYYKELRSKMGEAEFYKPQVQQQLFKDRERLGADFWKTT